MNLTSFLILSQHARLTLPFRSFRRMYVCWNIILCIFRAKTNVWLNFTCRRQAFTLISFWKNIPIPKSNTASHPVRRNFNNLKWQIRASEEIPPPPRLSLCIKRVLLLSTPFQLVTGQHPIRSCITSLPDKASLCERADNVPTGALRSEHGLLGQCA